MEVKQEKRRATKHIRDDSEEETKRRYDKRQDDILWGGAKTKQYTVACDAAGVTFFVIIRCYSEVRTEDLEQRHFMTTKNFLLISGVYVARIS
jgi:hypothetical protein